MTTQPPNTNREVRPPVQIVDVVVRFLKDCGFDKASWDTDLVCYTQGNRYTRHMVECNGDYDIKCRWYELELFLEKELGLMDPKRPRTFLRDKPKRK